MASSMDNVALLAGVSKATVSRVVNDSANVSPETARAVRQAMAQAQYIAPLQRPARPQATRPTKLAAYALLVPEISGDLYTSLLDGFEAASKRLFHHTIVCNTNDDLNKQGNDVLQLIHKRVAGVAIVPVASSPTPISHIVVLQSQGIPVVLLHRDVEGSSAPLIALPLRESGHRAAQELVNRGHRRIALFTGTGTGSATLHRVGLESALRERNLSLPEKMVCRSAALSLSLHELEASIEEHVARLWSAPQDERPTAVYVTANIIAEILYVKLLQRGLKIGSEVSILAFGSSQRSGAINSRLSSIVVDESAIARLAVDVLAEPEAGKMRGKDDTANRSVHEVDLSLALGETLGPVP